MEALPVGLIIVFPVGWYIWIIYLQTSSDTSFLFSWIDFSEEIFDLLPEEGKLGSWVGKGDVNFIIKYADTLSF